MSPIQYGGMCLWYQSYTIYVMPVSMSGSVSLQGRNKFQQYFSTNALLYACILANWARYCCIQATHVCNAPMHRMGPALAEPLLEMQMSPRGESSNVDWTVRIVLVKCWPRGVCRPIDTWLPLDLESCGPSPTGTSWWAAITDNYGYGYKH